MNGIDEESRIIELPFRFSQTVYHRAATERVPGIVCGFGVNPGNVTVRVAWGDTRSESYHFATELLTEYVANS